MRCSYESEHAAHIVSGTLYRGRRFPHHFCSVLLSMHVRLCVCICEHACTTRVSMYMCVDVHGYARACVCVCVRRRTGIRKRGEQMKNSKERAAIKRGERQNLTAV